MKYIRRIGYSVLFSTAMLAMAGMDVQAEENTEIPVPVDIDVETDEPLTEDMPEEIPVVEGVPEEPSTAALAEDSQKNEVNNGIPVIYLNIDESKGTIDAMNSDASHKTYCYGTLDFKLPSADFKYADLETDLKEYIGLDMQIKGRGNSTWGAEKKPYKVKLDKKTDLLGLGSDEKNKHWVLIANAYDATLIRDRLTGYIGEQTGLEYTPIGVPVDVVMNDKYLGNYLLMEHVRVGQGRIDIDELSADDVDPFDITGGYLVQSGGQSNQDTPNFFQTTSGEPWLNHTPSFDPNDDGYENEAQKNYIRNYMQMIDEMLYSDNQTDPDGNPYSKYMDLPSAAKYWLIQAISSNADSYCTGSAYLYKKRDTEDGSGKLYWGPIWDFDIAWGGDNVDDLGSAEGYNNILQGWAVPMMYDTGEGSLYRHILNEWPAVKKLMQDIISDGGMLDKYYAEMKASKAEDIKANPPREEQSDYQTIIVNQKKWIEHRINWLDEHLPELKDAVHKIKVVEEGRPDQIYYLRNDSNLSPLKVPERDRYIFIGWTTEDNKLVTKQSQATSDMILTPKYVTVEEATKYNEVIFQMDVLNIPFEKSIPVTPGYIALPIDAQYKNIKWESSDHSIATVNDSGKVTPQKPGSVTITAVLDDGSRWSCVLNFVEQKTAPQDVNFTENITLKAGEHRRIDTAVTPSSAVLDTVLYSLEGPDIIHLYSTTGVVIAREPGTTTVQIIAMYNDPSGKELMWKKLCTITVIEDKQAAEPPVDTNNFVSPVSHKNVHGVPTGVSTNTGFWLGSMLMVTLGMALSAYRRLFKKMN